MVLKTRLIIIVSILIFWGCAQKTPKCYPDYYYKNSGIIIEHSNDDVIENLEVLCRVWGFVKYHHPALQDSLLNIDFELFDLLPRIASANKDVRNSILLDWVSSIGKFRYNPQYYTAIKKDSNCISIVSCRWIEETEMLGTKLSKALQKLRYAERTSNPYINIDTKFSTILNFDENRYTGNIRLDQGYRLLSLFKYWNIIEYFFPYKKLTDKDWDSILPEYIEQSINIDDSFEMIQRLIAEINDTHAVASSVYLDPDYKKLHLDFCFIEDKLIVKKTHYASHELLPGDEIIFIDGKTPDDILLFTQEHISCSNRASLLREAANVANLVRKSDMIIKYKRNGSTKDIRLKAHAPFHYIEVENEPFQMLGDSIGYLYPASLTEFKNKNDFVNLKKEIDNTKVLILDHRCYPLLTSVIVFPFFIPQKTHITDIMKQLTELPGYFRYESIFEGFINDNAYKGKIIILVNEQTQSMGEYTTMILQTLPNTIVVGSQTAGADGNVAEISLPGSIKTKISGIGVFYPDRTQTQRIGIKIDYYVEPTIEGIKAERDEVLEKAFELIHRPQPDKDKQ